MSSFPLGIYSRPATDILRMPDSSEAFKLLTLVYFFKTKLHRLEGLQGVRDWF